MKTLVTCCVDATFVPKVVRSKRILTTRPYNSPSAPSLAEVTLHSGQEATNGDCSNTVASTQKSTVTDGRLPVKIPLYKYSPSCHNFNQQYPSLPFPITSMVHLKFEKLSKLWLWIHPSNISYHNFAHSHLKSLNVLLFYISAGRNISCVAAPLLLRTLYTAPTSRDENNNQKVTICICVWQFVFSLICSDVGIKQVKRGNI